MAYDYAFIGLGSMGYGMACNIRKKIPPSSTLHIYDVYRPVCDKFVSELADFGPITIAQSAKEAATNAKVILSSLPGAEEVSGVYLDKTKGVAAAPPDPDRLMLESSTIESSLARDIAEKLAQAKMGHYVDTPVSGGAQASINGQLSFMVGHATPEQSDAIGRRIEQTVLMMADPSKVFWCGRLGGGLVAKISNNYIACNVFLVVAEAITIGVRSGVDLSLLQKIIHNSSGQTFMGDIINAVPMTQLLSRDGFPTHIMLKDVELGIKAGEAAGINPSMALAAVNVWRKPTDNPVWDELAQISAVAQAP